MTHARTHLKLTYLPRRVLHHYNPFLGGRGIPLFTLALLYETLSIYMQNSLRRGGGAMNMHMYNNVSAYLLSLHLGHLALLHFAEEKLTQEQSLN